MRPTKPKPLTPQTLMLRAAHSCSIPHTHYRPQHGSDHCLTQPSVASLYPLQCPLRELRVTCTLHSQPIASVHGSAERMHRQGSVAGWGQDGLLLPTFENFSFHILYVFT